MPGVFPFAGGDRRLAEPERRGAGADYAAGAPAQKRGILPIHWILKDAILWRNANLFQTTRYGERKWLR